MASSSSVKTPPATDKSASVPSVGSSSAQPAAPVSPVSKYRVGTAVMSVPKLNATIEASGDDALGATSPARVLPKQVLSSEDNYHNDSESAYSNFSTTHGAVDSDNYSDSNSTSVIGTNSIPRPKAKGSKQTLGKRVRADSNAESASSNEAAVVPAKKPAGGSAVMSAAPPATLTTSPVEQAGKSGSVNYSEGIFMVELGLGGSTYYLHQSLLPRLLKLAEEMQKVQEKEKAKTQAKEDAKAKGKGQGKGQGRGAGKAPAMITITIMAHDRDAFGQMIDYLYRDQFVWKKKVPTERLDEMRELMSLAKYYALPGLQKQIVKLFSSSKLIHRVSPGRFFDWAEDMYSEEIHHENGPFTVYFSKTAPGLMKQVDEATKADMSRMIKSGGGFADQLYRALFVAFETQTESVAVKKEDSVPAPRLTSSSKGKEPVQSLLSHGP